MGLRDLYIEKGHIEQLQRHIEKYYGNLRDSTIIDLKHCFQEKLSELDLKIKQNLNS